MQLRADLDQYVFVNAQEAEWVDSPLRGVQRLMLDRDGDEVAIASSIVRYAKGAEFSPHQHARGEEFVVLEGVFSDEHGDYPPMTYVRNPPGTAHAPYSDDGCIIYVKLRQFAEDDLSPLTTTLASEVPAEGAIIEPLHQHGGEVVQLVRAASGTRVALAAQPQAQELFVLDGAVTWQTEVTRELPRWSWLRVPPGCPLRVHAVGPLVALAKTRPKSHQ